MRRLYRSVVPEGIRNPIGQFRRGLVDRLHRLRAPWPLPPRELLLRVQLTPWVDEYLEVGRRASADLLAVLDTLERPSERSPVLLDLGCGTARITRHLLDCGWTVHGCDIDADAIRWADQAIPGASFVVNRDQPPLPFPDHHFDALVAVSVFTHFDRAQQGLWFEEIGRILRPGGHALISTMGPRLLEHFHQLATAENVATLAREGFLFQKTGPAFNQAGAFHGPEILVTLAAPHFELLRLEPQGLAGFQDLAVLRRR